METHENQPWFNELINKGEKAFIIRRKMNMTPSKYAKMLGMWLEQERIKNKQLESKIEVNKQRLTSMWWRINEILIQIKTSPNSELEKEFDDLKIKYANKTIFDDINTDSTAQPNTNGPI